MFDAQHQAIPDLDVDWVPPSTPPLPIAPILAQCIGLPRAILNQGPTRQFERVLTGDELNRLTNAQAVDPKDTRMLSQLRVRRKVLTPHVGQVLLCLFYRLPGVHYTIEVDPRRQVVVHWEWQRY